LFSSSVATLQNGLFPLAKELRNTYASHVDQLLNLSKEKKELIQQNESLKELHN